MKRLILLFSGALFFNNCVFAQQNESSQLDSLKAAFGEAISVVHVTIKDFKVVQDLAGVHLYRVRAFVEESFKGNLKEGQTIHYYVQVPDDERFRKEQQLIFFRVIRYERNKIEPYELRHIRGDLLIDALTYVRKISFNQR